MIKQIFVSGCILFISIGSNAQKLEDCSQCASVKYTTSDIIDNKLFELKLLRNEIFARHHYSFNNQRLEEYYSNYEWYTPSHKNPIKNVQLTAIEQGNIDLFKSREETITENRKLFVNALKQLKSAIKEKNTSFIQTTFNGVVKKEDGNGLYTAIITTIDNVLTSINIDDINWHKGNAQYEILIDNGFSISSKGIYIKGDSVTIMNTDPQGHSNLMNTDDAFEYPSDYYSESENTSGAEFEFKNSQLILIRPMFAG